MGTMYWFPYCGTSVYHYQGNRRTRHTCSLGSAVVPMHPNASVPPGAISYLREPSRLTRVSGRNHLRPLAVRPRLSCPTSSSFRLGPRRLAHPGTLVTAALLQSTKVSITWLRQSWLVTLGVRTRPDHRAWHRRLQSRSGVHQLSS
jgi:hypothetical protein